jgi:CheY-like chemotaxis protein
VTLLDLRMPVMEGVEVVQRCASAIHVRESSC